METQNQEPKTQPAAGGLMASAELDKLYSALAKFQGAVTNPPKNREVEVTMKSGGKYKYSYAELPTILDTIRKPLMENELCLFHAIGGFGGRFGLLTTLGHSSGQFVRCFLELNPAVAVQDLGSEITYKRRYSVTALLGIASEDDDDGAAAHDAHKNAPKGRQQAGAAPKDKAAPAQQKAAYTPPKDFELKLPAADKEPGEFFLDPKAANWGELGGQKIAAIHPEALMQAHDHYEGQSVKAKIQPPVAIGRFMANVQAWLADQGPHGG